MKSKDMERAKGFEPSTPTLARLCSTPELRPLWRWRGQSVLRGSRAVNSGLNALQPHLSAFLTCQEFGAFALWNLQTHRGDLFLGCLCPAHPHIGVG